MIFHRRFIGFLSHLLLTGNRTIHTEQSLSTALSASIVSKVSVVLSDMDGTLLGPDHKVSQRNLEAVEMLQKKGIPFFPATGRTRQSILATAGADFVKILSYDGEVSHLSGVFSQGLVVAGRNGEIIYEAYLSANVIAAVEEYCQQHNFSLIAYAGDTILTTRQTPYTDLIAHYREMPPQLSSKPLHELPNQGIALNKLIILAKEEALQAHRPVLTQLLHNEAVITKAVPEMLEILPHGTSKGHGVRILLDHYGLSLEECLAFGDGENDIEMFEAVRYGIAVANARPELIKHATLTTLSNHADGVAAVLEGLFKQP